MIDVFTFSDYRLLLRALYEEKKAANSKFTFGFIAMKAGFTSRSFFTQVLQGKAKLSYAMIPRFAQTFQLNKRESDFFQHLVLFNQAKTDTEKRIHFKNLLHFRPFRIKNTDAAQYRFYDKWYYSAIRALIGIVPFQNDYEALAKKLVPAISAAEARKAVELLDSLGMIRKNALGHFELVENFISTGSEARSLSIANFQKATMDLSKGALDRFPREDRDSHTLTLAVSKAGYQAIRERTAVYRKEMMEIAAQDQKENIVYQVNIHIFPLTQPGKDGQP